MVTRRSLFQSLIVMPIAALFAKRSSRLGVPALGAGKIQKVTRESSSHILTIYEDNYGFPVLYVDGLPVEKVTEWRIDV